MHTETVNQIILIIDEKIKLYKSMKPEYKSHTLTATISALSYIRKKILDSYLQSQKGKELK